MERRVVLRRKRRKRRKKRARTRRSITKRSTATRRGTGTRTGRAGSPKTVILTGFLMILLLRGRRGLPRLACLMERMGTEPVWSWLRRLGLTIIMGRGEKGTGVEEGMRGGDMGSIIRHRGMGGEGQGGTGKKLTGEEEGMVEVVEEEEVIEIEAIKTEDGEREVITIEIDGEVLVVEDTEEEMKDIGDQRKLLLQLLKEDITQRVGETAMKTAEMGMKEGGTGRGTAGGEGGGEGPE